MSCNHFFSPTIKERCQATAFGMGAAVLFGCTLYTTAVLTVDRGKFNNSNQAFSWGAFSGIVSWALGTILYSDIKTKYKRAILSGQSFLKCKTVRIGLGVGAVCSGLSYLIGLYAADNGHADIHGKAPQPAIAMGLLTTLIGGYWELHKRLTLKVKPANTNQTSETKFVVVHSSVPGPYVNTSLQVDRIQESSHLGRLFDVKENSPLASALQASPNSTAHPFSPSSRVPLPLSTVAEGVSLRTHGGM